MLLALILPSSSSYVRSISESAITLRTATQAADGAIRDLIQPEARLRISVPDWTL